ncbi:elongator complex protein 6-like [Physella acuta]|uniref:elongator complex protein 6-like n=1 Tax=Physella acuta TaxID=109671 RepID=UPI0027DDCD15|nr:elongator complex protein 6-like [Physella acuta]
MLAQICQFLAVDSSNFPQNEHIIIGDRSHEGGFLIHYFLNLCLKQKRPVCFIGLSQSFNHFNTVAQKLGTNLLSARDENKNLLFLEGLKLLSECITQPATELSETKLFLSLLSGDQTPFLDFIKSALVKLSQLSPHSAGPVVIVDDLTVLLRAGLTTPELTYFVNSLNNIVTLGALKGSLVLFSNLDEEDEEANEVWAFMSHLSSLKIEVSDLKSGYCKDVHGQILIEWKDSPLKPRKHITKHTQFKLSDKSVELFASGMSAAVL